MKRFKAPVVCAALLAAIQFASAQGTPAGQRELPEGPGKDQFVRACSQCHELTIVTDRRNSRTGWSTVMDSMISMGAPLTPSQADAVLDYLAQNFSTGSAPVAAAPSGSASHVGIREDAALFLQGAPVRMNPLDKITPVTDAMLRNPPEGDWLTWRRTYDDHGFSSLKQINKTNVTNLRVAWAWSLPPGPNEGTPLVHDGVLFVLGYGDHLQALDAVTGELLWQYSRTLSTRPTHKKNLAIYGDKVFVATSDAHVVALDIKTGDAVWDREVAAPDQRLSFTGGPLVAKGKVMIGTRGRAPGGNYIVGLDAETGLEAWRFQTIAQPGEPGGDSWNGLPLEERNGASLWTAGSYDPDLNLAYFGVAQTYDTGPLRELVNQPGVTNDALFTDSTVAVNPDTGKLVWHFQHAPNDQWDMDWAFEQMVITLPVNGQSRKLVVTAGKPMIYDAVDAATGQYVFSKDLGLQNLFTAIDPITGAKTVNPEVIPGKGPFMLCPYFNSGKEWIPASYNSDTKLLYVPLNEACVDIFPLLPGQRGLLTGLGYKTRPVPGSDGKRGRLVALNVETREVAWMNRQREALTTGTLATAGGLVFAGSVDRRFSAYDDQTGKLLWQTRLNDLPSSAPISYSVNGRQYVAMVVGCCGVQAQDAKALNPELTSPPDGGAAIWVFELPEAGKQ